MRLTIGSLCSGYGGLDLGVQQVLDARVAWHCEFAAAPSKILAHHWPDVPNHRDLTTTDWAAVEPVDILTGGYPCQPFSHAGKRKGTADERHIWPFIADAVRVLRPRLLLFENVAGHVSLGLDVVLGDLAALGYDARWGCLRAADVGAPHGRARVFIAATDTRGQRYGRGQDGGAVGRVDGRGEGEAQQRQRARGVSVDRGASAAAVSANLGHERPRRARDGWAGSANGGIPAADTEDHGRTHVVAGGRHTELAGLAGDWARTAADVAGAERGGPERQHLPASARSAAEPRERAGAGAERGSAPTDDTGNGRHEGRPEPTGVVGGSDAAERSTDVQWGVYEPAIRRWERASLRPAPRPTEPGSRGGQRLNPRFVEWMMGLPAGHVTDVPGLSRNDQLKALGNGVVPAQAAAAYAALLGASALAVAA